jgi:hypothetical protein
MPAKHNLMDSMELSYEKKFKKDLEKYKLQANQSSLKYFQSQ